MFKARLDINTRIDGVESLSLSVEKGTWKKLTDDGDIPLPSDWGVCFGITKTGKVCKKRKKTDTVETTIWDNDEHIVVIARTKAEAKKVLFDYYCQTLLDNAGVKICKEDRADIEALEEHDYYYGELDSSCGE